MLTGPNGTGKSTIVSAIVLGLGGDPQLLDRSSSIADYIQSGKNAATIIITIFGRNDQSTEAFKRMINHNGESRFFVNTKEFSKTKYLSFIAAYNIQVNNLCQFLPQDRVQVNYTLFYCQNFKVSVTITKIFQVLIGTKSYITKSRLLNLFRIVKKYISSWFYGRILCGIINIKQQIG